MRKMMDDTITEEEEERQKKPGSIQFCHLSSGSS